MKQALYLLLLLFSFVANAKQSQEPRFILESGIETKAFVQNHLLSVQQQAALQSDSEQVYFDDLMVCLSSHSYIPEVGVCQLTGTLEEGANAVFVVVVSEANPGSGNGKVSVQVMRVSTVLL